MLRTTNTFATPIAHWRRQDTHSIRRWDDEPLAVGADNSV